MAKVGTKRAAELTGKSKSTIQRAMNNGKISFERDANDRRVVDVAELERVYGLIPQKEETESVAVEAELEKAKQMIEVERLKMKVKMLEEKLEIAEEQIGDLKIQRDKWEKQAQQVLLTSQYSQKQAEEYKMQLQMRQKRARAQRQKELEQRMKTMQGKNQNVPKSNTVSKNDSKSIGENIQGFFSKFRNDAEDSATAATEKESSKKAASA